MKLLYEYLYIKRVILPLFAWKLNKLRQKLDIIFDIKAFYIQLIRYQNETKTLEMY